MNRSNKLNIDLEKDSIVINIDSLGDELKRVKNYIQKNFKDYTIDIDTITIVPNLLASKDEMFKRLKLIKWVVKESQIIRENPNLAKKILKSYEQKIKISIQFYKVNQDIISIRLFKYRPNILILKIQNNLLSMISNIILNFLKRQCNSNDIIKFDKENSEIFFNTESETFIKSLKEILNRNSIVGKRVLFFYEESYINSLLKNYKESKESGIKIDSAKEYILKLRKSYKILQIEKTQKDLNLIKIQYLKLVKTYHPDKHYKKENIKDYENKFLEIKEAYETIKKHLEKKRSA